MGVKFATWLRKARKARKCSQRKIAEECGLGATTVHLWEAVLRKGEAADRTPDMESLEKLARVFGVSLSSITELVSEDETGKQRYDLIPELQAITENLRLLPKPIQQRLAKPLHAFVDFALYSPEEAELDDTKPAVGVGEDTAPGP